MTLPWEALPYCHIHKGHIEQGKIWWKITGYESDREQGGTNYVLGRERTGEAICNECAMKLRLGLLGQESLL